MHLLVYIYIYWKRIYIIARGQRAEREGERRVCGARARAKNAVRAVSPPGKNQNGGPNLRKYALKRHLCPEPGSRQSLRGRARRAPLRADVRCARRPPAPAENRRRGRATARNTHSKHVTCISSSTSSPVSPSGRETEVCPCPRKLFSARTFALYNFISPRAAGRRRRRARVQGGGIFKSGRPVTHPHRPHPHRLHSQRRRLAAGSSRSPCTLQQTRLRTSAFVPAPERPRGDEISNCVRRGRPLFGIHAAAVLRSEPRGWP